MEPGLYRDMPAKDYHADPIETGSLSCSTMDLLLERTPAHVKATHPRLRSTEPEPEEHKHNPGTLVHELLAGTADVMIIEEDSYRKKLAAELRDDALAAGKTPCLAHQFDRADAIVSAIKEQFDEHPLLRGVLASPEADKEVTALWRDEQFGGVWCRSRPDLALPRAIYDFKITGIAATPEAWGTSHAWKMGYARRAVWYRRGWRILADVMPTYRFVVCENEPPYAVSVFECSNEALDLATREVMQALSIWQRCMEGGIWPGYSTELQWINPPAWAQYRSEEVLARHTMGDAARLTAAEKDKAAEDMFTGREEYFAV
jgi:hypothetical protein